jgi:hypothetical protein
MAGLMRMRTSALRLGFVGLFTLRAGPKAVLTLKDAHCIC